MSRRSRFIPLLFVLLASSLPLLASDQSLPWVEEAWLKAMRANDLDAVVALYAPDAVAWFPDSPAVHGQKDIRAVYEGMLTGNKLASVTFTDTHHRTSGNITTGWGRFEMTMTPKAGGAPMVMKGRFTDVSERRNGKWFYIVDHASNEPAAEPAKK